MEKGAISESHFSNTLTDIVCIFHHFCYLRYYLSLEKYSFFPSLKLLCEVQKYCKSFLPQEVLFTA